MKDYIALVTVELRKFARQIASLRAGGRRLDIFGPALGYCRSPLRGLVSFVSPLRGPEGPLFHVTAGAGLNSRKWEFCGIYLAAEKGGARVAEGADLGGVRGGP